AFEGHLKHEYAAENLWFWKRAVKFRSAAASGKISKMKDQAKEIYEEFIKPDAQKMINISSNALSTITKNLESPEEILQPDCFDQAVREVEVIMTYGPFPRFADQIVDDIEESWKIVVDEVGFAPAGELFYSILFEMAPAVKDLFSRSKRVQGEMLMSMVNSSISLLNKLDQLLPVLVDLGVRHKEYGCKAGQFEVVGAALIETLSRALGDRLTPSIKDSWVVVYTLISNIMISTLDKEPEPAPVEIVKSKSFTTEDKENVETQAGRKRASTSKLASFKRKSIRMLSPTARASSTKEGDPSS
ncbi:unnamed protein product, partial [Chrysoparadoxa australica]